MRLSKVLGGTTFITLFALLYVWQQTEIFRLAYEGQKKQAEFQEELDKNSQLRYTLKKSSSLTRIGNRIPLSQNFHLPEAYMLVKLNSNQAGNQEDRSENMVARLFTLKRQAEAKTISPVVPFNSTGVQGATASRLHTSMAGQQVPRTVSH